MKCVRSFFLLFLQPTGSLKLFWNKRVRKIGQANHFKWTEKDIRSIKLILRQFFILAPLSPRPCSRGLTHDELKTSPHSGCYKQKVCHSRQGTPLCTLQEVGSSLPISLERPTQTGVQSGQVKPSTAPRTVCWLSDQRDRVTSPRRGQPQLPPPEGPTSPGAGGPSHLPTPTRSTSCLHSSQPPTSYFKWLP